MTDMYTGGELPETSLFEEVKEAAKMEKIRTFEEYKSLIDDIVEDKLDQGFLDANEDVEQIKANLGMRWKEIDSNLERVITTFS